MSLEALLQTLDPTVAKQFKTAMETKTERLPLASYNLTEDLNGGIGKGRITLIYGNTSAGKTTLMMQSIAMWQAMGQNVAFVDVEGTWDNDWAVRLGVDPSEVILIRERAASKVYNKIKGLLEAGIDAIVIDSISLILPDGFIDSDGRAKGLEDHKQLGAQAKAISQLCNAITYSNENTAVVLLSQTTTEIGQTYTKQIPHGGKKPMFVASQVIKLTSSNTEKEQIKGNVQVGNKLIEYPVARKVGTLVEKNKLGPQGHASKYTLYYDGPFVGIDHVLETVDQAVKFGVIKKTGSWYTYGDLKWQGDEKVATHFRSLPDDLEVLRNDISEVKNGSIRQEEKS